VNWDLHYERSASLKLGTTVVALWKPGFCNKSAQNALHIAFAATIFDLVFSVTWFITRRFLLHDGYRVFLSYMFARNGLPRRSACFPTQLFFLVPLLA
jgi:hypothetical protein